MAAATENPPKFWWDMIPELDYSLAQPQPNTPQPHHYDYDYDHHHPGHAAFPGSSVQVVRNEAEKIQSETRQGNGQQTCQCAENLKDIISGVVEDSVTRAVPLLIGALRSESRPMFLEMEAMHSHMAQRFGALLSLMEEVPMMTGQSPGSRLLPRKAESPISPTFQLHFKGTFPPILSTLTRIREYKDVQLELQDDLGNLVKAGPESYAKIKIVVLDGDFNKDDWTEEEFNHGILQPRKDKGPLLKGEYDISLSEGVATVDNICFTDNSSKVTKNGHFRFGAQAVKGLTSGVRIKEAVSEPFIVKERRCLSHKKHETPKLGDEVCRLQNIGHKGVVSKRLEGKNILKVKDFLQLYHTDEVALREIANIGGMKWRETVNHAKSCELTDDYYTYSDDAIGIQLKLNCVFDIINVTFKGQGSRPYDGLPESLKELLDKIRRNAYEKRNKRQKICNAAKQISEQAGPPASMPQTNVQHLDVPTNQGILAYHPGRGVYASNPEYIS